MSSRQQTLATTQTRRLALVLLGVLVLATVGLIWVGRGLATNLDAARAPWAALSTDQRMIRVADDLQCPVCEGQSVAFSNSPLATEMRRVITEKLEAGESEAQIMDYFVERYGVQILRQPPRTGLNAWLWITPVVAFVVASAWLVWALWRISRRRSVPADTSDAPALDDDLRDLLAHYDEELFSR